MRDVVEGVKALTTDRTHLEGSLVLWTALMTIMALIESDDALDLMDLKLSLDA